MTIGEVKALIRDVPDFPKPGVLFKDITPVLQHAEAYQFLIDEMTSALDGIEFSKIAGIESRGFVFGAPIAYKLGKGFIMLRKKGKLPYTKESECYDLEYGVDCIEVHVDSVEPGESVIIVDDVLATGGTALHAAKLIEKIGGKVAGFLFFVELEFLHGREKLKDYNVISMVRF